MWSGNRGKGGQRREDTDEQTTFSGTGSGRNPNLSAGAADRSSILTTHRRREASASAAAGGNENERRML